MGLGTARTTSAHTHTSHPQFSQPRYPITFGLGILFWCLGSPAPRGIAEPTIAALCPTACPKNLCSPPPSSLLAPKQSSPERLSTLRGEALHPSLHKTLPFTFSFFFFCIPIWSPFCSPASEERSLQQGQHPPSPQGAGASSLCLAGADIFLFVSLVSLVSRFFFLTEPLIKKKLGRIPRFGVLGGRPQLPLQACPPRAQGTQRSCPGSLVLPQSF